MPLSPVSASLQIPGNFGAPVVGGEGKSFEQLKKELKLALGNRSDLDDMLGVWINDAYRDMAGEVKVPDLMGEAVVATNGDRAYLLPSNVDYITDVEVQGIDNYGDAYKLTPIDRSTYTRYAHRDGLPNRYYREGKLLVLYPQPDDSYTLLIRFRIKPSPLATPTHRTIYGSEWDTALLWKARYIARSATGEPELAAVAQNEYTNAVRSKMDKLAEEKSYGVTGINYIHKASQLRRL